MAQAIDNKKKFVNRKIEISDHYTEKPNIYEEKKKVHYEQNWNGQNNYHTDSRPNRNHVKDLSYDGPSTYKVNRNEMIDRNECLNSSYNREPAQLPRAYNVQTNKHNHQNEDLHRTREQYNLQDNRFAQTYYEHNNNDHRQKYIENNNQHQLYECKPQKKQIQHNKAFKEETNQYDNDNYTNEDLEHIKTLPHKCSLAVMKERQERLIMKTINENDELNCSDARGKYYHRLDGPKMNRSDIYSSSTQCADSRSSFERPNQYSNGRGGVINYQGIPRISSTTNDSKSYSELRIDNRNRLREDRFAKTNEHHSAEYSDELDEDYEAHNPSYLNDNNNTSDGLLIGPRMSSRSINSNTSICSKKAEELLKLERSKCNILTSIDDGIKKNFVDVAETTQDRNCQPSPTDTNSFDIISNLVRQRRTYHAQKIIQEANRIKQIDRFPTAVKK